MRSPTSERRDTEADALKGRSGSRCERYSVPRRRRAYEMLSERLQVLLGGGRALVKPRRKFNWASNGNGDSPVKLNFFGTARKARRQRQGRQTSNNAALELFKLTAPLQVWTVSSSELRLVSQNHRLKYVSHGLSADQRSQPLRGS